MSVVLKAWEINLNNPDFYKSAEKGVEMGYVENLEEELAQLYKTFDSICDELGKLAAAGISNENTRNIQFQYQVQQEVYRSSRYNHFFALATFPVLSESSCLGMELLREQLRTSDIIAMISLSNPESGEGGEKTSDAKNNGESRKRLAVLMPETNRKGAEIAIWRIMDKMADSLKGAACAVYPDDATDARTLMNMALAG